MIQVTDVKPGSKKWTQVRDQLSAAVERQLLADLAGRQRDKAAIEFTGAAAHFQPGTRQLVLPAPRSKQDPAKAKPQASGRATGPGFGVR